jgi:hypothetical protein
MKIEPNQIKHSHALFTRPSFTLSLCFSTKEEEEEEQEE